MSQEVPTYWVVLTRKAIMLSELENWGRFGVGFDTIADTRRNLLENIKRAQSAFPPYNIRKSGDNKYIIEIAAAGYSLGDFEMTLEEDVLHITCTPPKEDSKDFVHQGLSYKAWSRDFILKDGVKVKNASLVNGMLKVFLEYITAEEKKPLKINIDAPSEKLNPQLLNESSNF